MMQVFKKCPECHKIVPIDVNYCPYCIIRAKEELEKQKKIEKRRLYADSPGLRGCQKWR